MSPKERLHQNKQSTQLIASFVAQPLLKEALDWALLEMQHQCARSSHDPASNQWKQTGALEFCEILLNIAKQPELRKSQPPTQLNHNA